MRLQVIKAAIGQRTLFPWPNSGGGGLINTLLLCQQLIYHPSVGYLNAPARYRMGTVCRQDPPSGTLSGVLVRFLKRGS